jgi:hypothetical protein
MRTVVYITKKKIWAGERAFDWNGESMDEVFGRIKKELRIDEIRVVLGNDVSFVTAVKAGNTFITRENVLKLVKPWMPFEIDSGSFDWKLMELAHDEIWIQIVALEKDLLLSLSAAVKNYDIKVELVTTVGVLLGNKTLGREAPTVIKWTDRENLMVLAINGLVDLVVSGIGEEDLMIYASHKWDLAVNPEVISLDEKEFNLSKSVFSEDVKGEDGLILNLPILKDVVEKKKLVKNDGEIEVKREVKKRSWFWLLLFGLAVTGTVGVVYLLGLL